MATGLPSTVAVHPTRRVSGRLTVPGDKSVSHRYALLGALARGRSVIQGYAPGADCHATLGCLRRLGVEITETPDTHDSLPPTLHITGRGLRGLSSPTSILDAENSGTTMRLLAGVLAAHPFESVLTGDSSLRRRPMRRVIVPLERM